VLLVRALVKAVFVAVVVQDLATAAWRGPTRGVVPAPNPLRGAWDVTDFRRAAGSSRGAWQVLAIATRATLRTAGDTVVMADWAIDSTARRLALYPMDSMLRRDSTRALQLQFTLRGERSAGSVILRIADTLVLAGAQDGDSVHATLVRRDVSTSPLLRRGFHWIQEYPFNR
jgi:hypothetical protein